MKLLRLHVGNFGKLHDYRMEFNDSLNVIHEENGWGKSTLAAFIKAMLYGLPATTKRSLDRNDRKRYTPWQGGAFGGSLEIETPKGAFRVERFFGEKESADTFALYDLSTNRPSDAYSDTLGEELFGIDADGFERTVYLAQRAIPIEGDNNSITAKLVDLLDAVDDIGSYDDAVKALEDRRRHYVMTGNRGHIAELEKERSGLLRERDDLRRVESSLAEKEKQLAECRDAIAIVQEEARNVQKRLRRAGAMRERAAHVDQKNRMLKRLSDLDVRKKQLEALLKGRHPTDAELDEQRGLLERSRNAKARLEAIPAEETACARLEILPTEVVGQCPDATLLNGLSEKNGRLVKLSNRREVLLETLRQTQMGFEKGAPSDDDLNKMYRALDRVDQLCDGKAHRKNRLWIPALIFFAVAGICAVLSFADLVPFLFPVLCGLFCTAAILLLVAGVLKNSRESKNARMIEEKHAQEKTRTIGAVRQFLSSYGVPTEGDLRRHLDTLAALSSQYRQNERSVREYRSELSGIEEQHRRIVTVMLSEFRLFGLSLSEQNDYQAEISALMRDLSMLENTRKAEEDRRRSRAEAKTDWDDIRARMRPFLRFYDPEQRLSDADCIRGVEANEAEYRRAVEDEKRMTRELTAFIREKGLDTEVDESEIADALRGEGDLNAHAESLQHRLEGLFDDQSGLKDKIAAMRDDTERMFEVEARLVSLDEQIAEETANSRTIELTEKYLKTAKDALSTRYLSDMQSSFSKFLEMLIEDEPPESVMDPSFAVSLRADGKTRPVESFSRGWRDAVQFCVRLSLADALYKDGERPFLLLDDPFVNLDDTRLAAAKRLLERLSRQYQIIYMICHADRG